MFAHRGGRALAPENTLAAFDSGLALGADGIELDVHLSRDGVVVAHHDPTLERTTNLTGPIASRTADELARADAGYRFRRVPDAPHDTRDVGFITRPWGPPSRPRSASAWLAEAQSAEAAGGPIRLTAFDKATAVKKPDATTDGPPESGRHVRSDIGSVVGERPWDLACARLRPKPHPQALSRTAPLIRQ